MRFLKAKDKSNTRRGGGSSNRDNLELQAFREPNKKRKIILITVLFSMLILSGMYLYKTYAAFTEEKHFNVINGTVGDPGDLYFAYYVDGEITRNMPKKGTDYTLDTEKSNCTNGVTVGWDQDKWTALVNYENYNATDFTRTKCNLYFKQTPYCDLHPDTMACQITTLAKTDTTNLAVDDYGNTRYIGADPNNYVRVEGEEYTSDIYYGYYSSSSTEYKEYSSLEECKKASSYRVNCKLAYSKGDPILWRVIGTMKDIDDGTGTKEDRVKIIRASSIGEYSWDTSESSVNDGDGVNEWSQAKLMKLLNPGYENESIGGSLYWNNQSGTCYVGSNNNTKACDFTSTGIKDKLKTLINDAVWNTGASTTESQIASKFYTEERGTRNGKICSSGKYCNDTVERTTSWTGKVGLMYPSDYGYATSGGSTTDRATCLNTNLFKWQDNSVSDCKNNDWLVNSSTQWTLSPSTYSSSAQHAYVVYNSGYVYGVYSVFAGFVVRPVVYLSSSVGVQSGDGSRGNPFTIR